MSKFINVNYISQTHLSLLLPNCRKKKVIASWVKDLNTSEELKNCSFRTAMVEMSSKLSELHNGQFITISI